MRRTLTALALVGLLLVACGSSKPGTPAPTVLGSQAPGQTTEAPARATDAPAPATQPPAPAPVPPAPPAPTKPPYTPPPIPHY
jgi:hypothetical protein